MSVPCTWCGSFGHSVDGCPFLADEKIDSADAARAAREESERMSSDGSNDFSTVLVALRQGDLNEECSEELLRLIGQLRRHSNSFGKAKGTMTLKLEIVVERDAEAVTITADIATKPPRAKQPPGVLWLRDDDSLSPRQKQLPLNIRDVSQPEKPARDVGQQRNVKGA